MCPGLEQATEARRCKGERSTLPKTPRNSSAWNHTVIFAGNGKARASYSAQTVAAAMVTEGMGSPGGLRPVSPRLSPSAM